MLYLLGALYITGLLPAYTAIEKLEFERWRAAGADLSDLSQRHALHDQKTDLFIYTVACWPLTWLVQWLRYRLALRRTK